MAGDGVAAEAEVAELATHAALHTPFIDPSEVARLLNTLQQLGAT